MGTKDKKTAENADKTGFFKRIKGSFGTLTEKSLKVLSEDTLADMVILAARKQEKVNKILKKRRSNYRIGNIDIGLSLPPTIIFGIRRIGDEEVLCHEALPAEEPSED